MRTKLMILFISILGVIIMLLGCSERPSNLIDCIEKSEELVTAIIGKTKYGSLYELGVVLVRYDEAVQRLETDVTNRVHVPAVNNFFTEKGHTPRVVGMFFGFEVINIGEYIDTEPMLEKLKAIPGVANTKLHLLQKTSDILSSDDELSDKPIETVVGSKSLIEVGKTEKGLLYELGIVLVQYDESTRTRNWTDASGVNPREIVHNFFTEKGYMPKEMGSPLYDFEFIHIGACVDTAPFLEGLKTIPGVIDAQLDVLYNTLDILSGKPEIPEVLQ